MGSTVYGQKYLHESASYTKNIITKQNKVKREAGRKKPINTTGKMDSKLILCLSDIKSDKNQENQGHLH